MCVCVRNCDLLSLSQFVHESLHDEVVEQLKEMYSQIKIGDPLNGEKPTISHPVHLVHCCSALVPIEDVSLGPVHSKAAVNVFKNAVAEAQAQVPTLSLLFFHSFISFSFISSRAV